MGNVFTNDISELNSNNLKVLNLSDFIKTSKHNSLDVDFYASELKTHFEDAVKTKRKLIIDLDDFHGHSKTLLDESFGRLIYEFSMKTVIEHIEIKSMEEFMWLEFICKDVIPRWENKRVNEYLCDIPDDELKLIWDFENEK